MLTSASDVVIVSGYYGEDFIRAILSATKGTAKKRTLTFVFAGLPDVAREEQVENLIRLRKDIIKATRCAQKNIDIFLSLDTRFLHAKVFRFRSKNKPPYSKPGTNSSPAKSTYILTRWPGELGVVIGR
jgi:hypothetical protein